MASLSTALIWGGLLIAGVIHLIPVVGVLGPTRLETLYGLGFSDPSLQVLMRHRAVLFGLLGLLLVASAFVPSLRLIALVAGYVSVLSFLALAFVTPEVNAGIQKVVRADWVALAGLVAATIGVGLPRLQ